MKKILLVLIALLLCTVLFACKDNTPSSEQSSNQTSDETFSEVSQTNEPTPDEKGRIDSDVFVYELQKNESILVENRNFNKSVTVNGNYGTVRFVNCKFEKGIVNTANYGTQIIINSDCEVTGKCTLKNSVSEGSIDTDLPKFVCYSKLDVETKNCIGAVVGIDCDELSFNEMTFPLSNCQKYITNEGMVDYNGQEANYFLVGTWAESGRTVIFSSCKSVDSTAD